MIKVNIRQVIIRIFVLVPLLCFLSICVSAQTKNENTNQQKDGRSTANSTTRTTANESFDLNISEKRIEETNFSASTEVATENADKTVSLRIGVSIGAGKIVVTLRNVRGRVNFRGSVEAINNLITKVRDANSTTKEK